MKTELLDKIEVVCNAAELSREEYALVRKQSFGASDSSILCGVNLYKKIPALIEEKNSTEPTKEELRVGTLPQVRKGYDLEDIILQKFIEATGIQVEKPEEMYRHKEFPFLTVNFDGLTEDCNTGGYVPVEIKLVTRYGAKYYGDGKPSDVLCTMIKDIASGAHELPANWGRRSAPLEDHIKNRAEQVGIPAYYYTQVQQQILFADAPYGILVAMFDDAWESRYYLVPRDEYTISNIISKGEKLSHKLRKDLG